MALTLIVTNAGRAALVNAANNGTAPVLMTQVGISDTFASPDPSATILPGEFKRIGAISGDVVADDTIHLIVRDESADVFAARSLALYLADGTLFGIYSQAVRFIEKSAQALMLLDIDVKFDDIAATTITFGNANFLNPPATTERQGVVELATIAEAQAGNDATRSLTPAAAKAAVLGWLLGQDGSGSGLDSDLFDGQDSGYYTNIVARLGYSPANKAGETFNGAFGRDAAYYFDFATGNPLINFALNDFLYYDRAADSFNVVIGNAQRAIVRADGWIQAQNGVSIAGSAAWHAGNDGAGSGLDADLLDGQDSGYYTNIVARLGYSPANKAGETFTGPFGRDNSFFFNLSGGQPVINLDANDYIYYDRTADTLSVMIGGTSRAAVRSDGWLVAQNGVSIAGSAAWHAGNDGAGSGLDADLLDGQDSGYYTNIVARLGYSPANKAGETFTGPFGRDNSFFFDLSGGQPVINLDANDYIYFDRLADTLNVVVAGTTRAAVRSDGWLAAQNGVSIAGSAAWHAGNDGSGSGLDADLLDGYQASAFALRNQSVTFGSVASDVGDGTGIYYFSTGGGRYLQYSGGTYYLAGGNLVINGSQAWHAGNDGSGSGLDADTLDGFHASDLLRVISESKAQSGYMRLSNGLLLQWGRWTSPVVAGQDLTVTFPVAFSAEPYTLVTMPVVTTSSGATTWSSDGITGTSFPARCSIASIGCRYFAIGPV